MKKLLTSKPALAVLALLAVGLLLTGTIGGIRAAVLRESPFYTAGLGMSDIGVTLVENGEAVGWRDYNKAADGSWNEQRGHLLAGMVADGETVQLGRAYPESLCVKNSGSIETYVRMSLYCYWTDADGVKQQALDPSYIGLSLLNGNGWVIDETASTAERTVLYYTRVLAPGETTPPCCESLTVDPAVRLIVRPEGLGTRSVYNGMRFCVEAEVDAVQTHNAADAIQSAWGRSVTVADGVLTLR